MMTTTKLTTSQTDTKVSVCGNGGIGAVILDKGNVDNNKICYLECRNFQTLVVAASSDVQEVETGIRATAEECLGNGVLVGFSGKDENHNPTTLEEPYYLTGLCRDLSGWTVNKENCVELTNPYHNGYWTGHSHTDDARDWDRFFDCPVQYLAVKLARTEDSGKLKYRMLKCCLLLPVK
ncbi:hypothetical protein Pmani_003434 [Petrolisthes manimaculis]|uniref:Uncharacterized protein n=1 Tax=Petrolisthes manimaculis TaxID=1843537 RepID=A0AAE1QFW1_9EUCA|nr:hypothetical protein Pmani_003434 [Petrolisthes manimaculis]